MARGSEATLPVRSLIARGGRALDAWLPENHYPPGSEARRGARLVALLALGAALGGLPYAPMFAHAGRTALALTSASFPLVFLLALVLLRRGQRLLAGRFVTIAFGAELVVQAAGTGGLRSPPLWCLPMLVAFARISLGKAGSIGAAAAVSLVALAFGVVTLVDGPLHDPLPPSPLADASVVVVLSWFAMWLMSVFEGVEQDMRHQIAARKAEAETAHAEVRVVLDTIEQGLLLLDREGRITRGYSRSVEPLLGEVRPGEPFGDVLGRIDRQLGAVFALGWQTLLEDVLPRELCIDQLPARVSAGGRTLALHYHPVGDGASMVVTVADVSAEVARQDAEQGQRELLATVLHLSRDRASYQWFLRETTAAVERVAEGKDELANERRAVHTIKGNAGFFGLAGMVAVCHTLETASMERQGPLTRSERELLRTRWRELRARVACIVDVGGAKIEIEPEEHRAFVAALARGDDRQGLLRIVRGWALERARRPLTLVGDQARALAQRLGRGQVDIEIEDGNVRLDADRYAPFWSSLTHVVRNAVDHGIEAPETRLALGKSERGHITLRCSESEDEVVVEVTDDGRGVDWDAIRARAVDLGLPVDGDGALEAAMFADGVSTRSEVTDISGRGVGLAAVASATRGLGGRVEVRSDARRGTTIRFAFPRRTRSSYPVRATHRPAAS